MNERNPAQGQGPELDTDDQAALDEALVGLPAPPQWRTRVVSVLLVAISAVALLIGWQLRSDVKYALSASTAVDLGDARAADFASAGSNRYVRVQVAPQMAGAVTYTRPLWPGRATVFPVAGRDGETVYVKTDSAARAGEYTGRLVRFSDAGGRYAAVGNFLRSDMNGNQQLRGEGWLLVEESTPRSTMWAPALMAFLLALALSNLALLVRLLKPLRLPDDLAQRSPVVH